MSREAVNPFNSIAKEYDQWFDDNKNTFLSELAAVKYFMPKQGKGLEIGIGTGRFTMELGIKYGIEPSEDMASIAKEKGIDVIIGNAENLPYDTASFDYAIMVAVDPFVENIEKVYLETFRILKPEGKFIIGTLHKEGEVAQKYMGMTDSEVYKSAKFHTISETIEQLKSVGFSTFNTCQSLFSTHPEKIETPIQGHDKGSFVAIQTIKEN